MKDDTFKEDKNGPQAGHLANVLYTLGLLSADEGKFLRLLTSRELEAFEERLSIEHLD